MAADDVPLTDQEVIGRSSVAVRGPVASRAEVVAALRSDLARLTGEAAGPQPAASWAGVRTRPVPVDRVPRRPAVEAPGRAESRAQPRPRRVPARRAGTRGEA